MCLASSCVPNNRPPTLGTGTWPSPRGTSATFQGTNPCQKPNLEWPEKTRRSRAKPNQGRPPPSFRFSRRKADETTRVGLAPCRYDSQLQRTGTLPRLDGEESLTPAAPTPRYLALCQPRGGLFGGLIALLANSPCFCWFCRWNGRGWDRGAQRRS